MFTEVKSKHIGNLACFDGLVQIKLQVGEVYLKSEIFKNHYTHKRVVDVNKITKEEVIFNLKSTIQTL